MHAWQQKEAVSASKELVLMTAPSAGGAVTWQQGADARAALGLPTSGAAKVAPSDLPTGCTLFVQSTSASRKLAPGTTLLVATPDGTTAGAGASSSGGAPVSVTYVPAKGGREIVIMTAGKGCTVASLFAGCGLEYRNGTGERRV